MSIALSLAAEIAFAQSAEVVDPQAPTNGSSSIASSDMESGAANESNSRPARPPETAPPIGSGSGAPSVSSHSSSGVSESAGEDAHEPEEPEEEEGLLLGAKGFGGVLFAGEETLGAFGGGFTLGVPVRPSLEIEGSLMWAQPGEERGFLIVEAIGKWVHDQEGVLHRHLLLGPLLSVDFSDPPTASVGLVGGFGVTWWTTPKFGATGDLAYRLLLGKETEQAITLAIGGQFRL